jgi:hypothetical protein
MIRNALVAAFLAATAVVTAGSTAAADVQDSRAGTKGHVTAWDSDKETVIDVDPCPRMGKYTYAYVQCGAKFRAKINDTLCRSRGKGKYLWFYQVGDSRGLVANHARCE